MARMPALIGSGRVGQASLISVRSDASTIATVALAVAVRARIGADCVGRWRDSRPIFSARACCKSRFETALGGMVREGSQVAAEGFEPPTRGL